MAEIKSGNFGGWEGMNFPQATEVIIDGGKVTRIAWADKNVYVLLRNGQLQIKDSAGYHPLIVSDGDMLADDWIVVEKGGKVADLAMNESELV